MDEFTAKITSNVITDLVKETINTIKSKTIGYFKDVQNKDEIDLGYCFEKYLTISSAKVRMVKNIVYRREPRDLYTIYENVNLLYNEKQILTDNMNNIIDIGHRIIITGTAGIGKTTMLRHIFINSIQNAGLIPVFVELRSVNSETKDAPLVDLIYTSIKNCGFELEKEYFLYSMEAGKYIILYDGFDEIKSEKNNRIASEIRDLSTKYPNNYYIMTSRPMDQFIGWNDFCEMQAMSLNRNQAISLIKRLEYDKNVKEKFIYELEHGLFEKYYSFASNPLLLTIMLLTFDERASIPDKLNDFYEQAFVTLFNVHDGSKDCFKRDIRTGLSYQAFKEVFAYFCFKTYFNSEYEFSESRIKYYLEESRKHIDDVVFDIDDYLEDLVKSVCVVVKEGLDYTFSHRSFQEYFAAYYTTKLSDNIQYRLLSSWLEEFKGSADDPYFSMLYNMQKEKFIKILLCPGLKEIKKMYNGRLSYECLTKLFSKIHIKKEYSKQNKDENYRAVLIIKNNYLCSTIRMSAIFTGYRNWKVSKKNEEFRKYLQTKVKGIDDNEIELEEIASDGMFDEFIDDIQWFDNQVKYSIEIYEKYSIDTSKNKRKVASIIDAL